MLHAREHEGDRRVFEMYVVDEQIILVESRLASELDDFRVRAAHANAFVPILAEDHRLAVF